MRRLFPAVLFSALAILDGCGGGRPTVRGNSVELRPTTYDTEFRRLWDDGAAEVTSYQTQRLRNGSLVKGAATMILRRLTYSEDERVPVKAAKRTPPGDLFPALQMNWIERYANGLATGSEMTTSAIALASMDGRVAGAETKAEFSFQGWDGQLFHELIFDATDVRSHQYSYFESEGDEQISLAYPRDGVAGDVLWLWARHMAAPALNPGEHRTVETIPTLREARERHRPLTWSHAVLSRAAGAKGVAGNPSEVFSVRWEDGATETFSVEQAAPFRVIEWENSLGERADFVSSSRVQMADWPVLLAPLAARPAGVPAQ